MTIYGPNPTFDPDGARRAVQQVYGVNLQTGGQIRDYAAAMLTRFTGACPTGPYDLAILGLFRQVVAGLDATLRLLEAGATYMAALPTRSIIETTWSIQWALRDPKRWGRQLYVATLRLDRRSIAQLIPGTPPNLVYRGAVASAFGADSQPTTDSDVAALQREYDSIDRLLGHDDYREINRQFDAAQGKREHDPPWYSVGPNSVASFADMARVLNREADYIVQYSPLSTNVHSASTHRHINANETGYWIEPIVSLDGLANRFVIATWFTVDAMRRLIVHYRPEEIVPFRRKFTEWELGLTVQELELTPIFDKW